MNFQVEYRAPMPLDIPGLESTMLKMPQEPAPVVHRFGPGIYIREVRLPAGSFVIGHEQLTEHLNIMLTGKVLMADGSVLEAPTMFVGRPGKKAGFIEEDCVWLNVYATEETDVDKLESMFLRKSEAFMAHRGAMDEPAAREDFAKMLDDLGVSAETVAFQSENESDQIAMPYGAYKFQLGPSPIHGKGIFSCGGYEAGEVIGEARINGMRTPLGCYTNHSGTPNAKMDRRGQDIYLVASRPITSQHGGWLGEEITVDYRVSVEVTCQA
jgi:hypothetical protein